MRRGEMEIRWTRTFDAGHRIWQHNEKCRFLHGHSYRVSIVARGSLNAWGMVVDFGDLKKIIVDRFDHKVILFKGEPLVPHLLAGGQKVVLLDRNPTAENLAVACASLVLSGVENLDEVEAEVFETVNQSGFCRMNRGNLEIVSLEEPPQS